MAAERHHLASRHRPRIIGPFVCQFQRGYLSVDRNATTWPVLRPTMTSSSSHATGLEGARERFSVQTGLPSGDQARTGTLATNTKLELAAAGCESLARRPKLAIQSNWPVSASYV